MISVTLKLPFVEINGEWQPQDVERQASWELYVELVTRAPVANMAEDEGILREQLTSLHSLFGTTRDILRRYGPAVAMPSAGTLSFGYLAIALLNGAIRPVLAYWHPTLQAYESHRPAAIAPRDHETSWPEAVELRHALDELRTVLLEYAVVLAEVTGAPWLLHAVHDTEPRPVSGNR